MFQLLHARAGRLDLLVGQGAHLRVLLLEHGLGGVEVLYRATVVLVAFDNGLELAVLHRQAAEALVIRDGLGVGQQGG